QGTPSEISVSAGWRIPPEAAVYLANSLRSRWSSYNKQLQLCQKQFSETSVHQLRVATRRLITHYALLRFMVSGKKAGKAQKKLKRHMKILGELRDVQVQRMF